MSAFYVDIRDTSGERPVARVLCFGDIPASVRYWKRTTDVERGGYHVGPVDSNLHRKWVPGPSSTGRFRVTMTEAHTERVLFCDDAPEGEPPK